MELITKMVKTVKYQLEKDKKIIGASFLIGLMITIFVGNYTKSYALKTSASLSSNIMRFHVLANSDSHYDQQLKLKVRDAVIAEYSNALDESKSPEETKEILSENINAIQELAQSVVREQGSDYSVSASITTGYFPTKNYGDITLPAGNYQALRIEIGDSQGQNWWCVMFPPLCFVDVTKNEIDPETKETLKNILTEEEYLLISDSARDEKIDVKVKFKIIEWWQNKMSEEETEEALEDALIVQAPVEPILQGSF